MRSKLVGPSLAVLFLVNALNYYDRQRAVLGIALLKNSQRSSPRRTKSSAVKFACRSIIDFRVLMVNVSPLP